MENVNPETKKDCETQFNSDWLWDGKQSDENDVNVSDGPRGRINENLNEKVNERVNYGGRQYRL